VLWKKEFESEECVVRNQTHFDFVNSLIYSPTSRKFRRRSNLSACAIVLSKRLFLSSLSNLRRSVVVSRKI
jgi:hypothetical protein